MTYFGVLVVFIGIPLAVLAAVTAYDVRCGRTSSRLAWAVLLAHVVIALVYTTPWDNYLVATRVWWYDPALVTGITLGWVPIEEYTFFVVQTLASGLWLLFWMRRLWPPARPAALHGWLRWASIGVFSVLWLASLGVLVAGWMPGWYLALILIWALPPIGLQLAFGADILWRHWRVVLMGIAPATLYLWLVDAIAIGSGTWTINPDRIVGFYLGGVLPVEEAIFFLVTNALVVLGMTLALAADSHVRMRELPVIGELFARLLPNAWVT
ncbi:MAG: lycopene cyclase domain-containing protein [Chloroflexi bacterium]|nr:lycopene cyclase domain-containing protein [Chloroflexota bacterium]MBU1751543.1 lycopene cyclase domain-containing protein [Chloroflexota bacterium]MBU1879176.1 lycopene cyclase domain-containing protein [Chloroflexota bacterium]